jgi:hypothetical protein
LHFKKEHGISYALFIFSKASCTTLKKQLQFSYVAYSSHNVWVLVRRYDQYDSVGGVLSAAAALIIFCIYRLGVSRARVPVGWPIFGHLVPAGT